MFNTPGPLDEWSAATSIAEHLTLRPSRFQVGCSRGAILTDPPKLRITLRWLLEVLRNETTAQRGGPGSFDGVEEGCSGLKSAAEASHGSRGASRCVSITRLGSARPRTVRSQMDLQDLLRPIANRPELEAQTLINMG